MRERINMAGITHDIAAEAFQLFPQFLQRSLAEIKSRRIAVHKIAEHRMASPEDILAKINNCNSWS